VFAVSVGFFVAPPSMQVGAESGEAVELVGEGKEYATEQEDRQAGD
jgi:hypothetical protein